jgi:exopolysaccharide biosynthesis predicted pyruvyltransferase EpsI
LIVSDSVTGERGVKPCMANLDKFLNADRIVAGRFHAACLAIMTGKPYSVYPSNTHKIKGMMKDANHPYCRTKDEALKCQSNSPGYLRWAKVRVPKMLAEVLALSVAAKLEA